MDYKKYFLAHIKSPRILTSFAIVLISAITFAQVLKVIIGPEILGWNFKTIYGLISTIIAYSCFVIFFLYVNYFLTDLSNKHITNPRTNIIVSGIIGLMLVILFYKSTIFIVYYALFLFIFPLFITASY